MQKKLKLKLGDTVKVLSGESKGQSGEILRIDREKSRVLVQGVNLIKKHVKPSAENPQGGIEEVEAPVHISNVMLEVGGQTTKVGRKVENDKLVRFARKTGEIIK